MQDDLRPMLRRSHLESSKHLGHPQRSVDPHRGANETFASRIGISQLLTLRWGLAEDIEHYARAAVPAIGLRWRKISEVGIAKTRRKVRRAALPVSSVGWCGGFTGVCGYSFQEAVVDARRLVQFASDVGASTVLVIAGPQGGHIRPHARRLLIEAMRDVGDAALDHGLTLSLLPMRSMYRAKWSFLNGLDETLELIDAVNHPAMRLAFNSFHLADEPDLLSRIGEILPRIGHVLLTDGLPNPRHENDQRFPGEGTIPLREMVGELEKCGYEGWYEVEVWSRDLWNSDYPDLIQECLRVADALSRLGGE